MRNTSAVAAWAIMLSPFAGVILGTWMAIAQSNVTISVPPGTVITIPTNAPPTNAISIMPPPATITEEQQATMALAMRMARMYGDKLRAPWVQRFNVVRVKVEYISEPVQITNFWVTVQAVPETETNSPIAWGATVSGLLTFRTTYPAKVGDAYDLFPARIP